jgi:DNA polymerase-3 subunit beta
MTATTEEKVVTSLAAAVGKEEFEAALTFVKQSVPNRPPVPVLACVELVAAGDTLRISTFDYELSAVTTIEARNAAEGTVLVGHDILLKAVKSLAKRSTVTLTQVGSKLVVTDGRRSFTLLIPWGENCPTLPAMPEIIGSIDGASLTQALAQVVIAASRDDTLPLLTTVRMEFEGDKITLLATDRYRLVVRELTWHPAAPDISAVALVRARTLTGFVKSLKGSAQINIALATGTHVDRIGFEAGGRRKTSLLVDGDYPAVRRLFPDETPIHAVVATRELSDAVKSVALCAERNTPVRLSFTAGWVMLDAGQGDDAQASETLDATLVGDDISVAFNPQFLLDGLGVLGTPFVRLSFTHPNKPVEFTAQTTLDGDDVKDYRYLLVPIRFAS